MKMKKFLKIVLGLVVAGVILAIGGVVVTLFAANEVVESVDTAIKEEEKKTDDKDALLQAMLDKAPAPVETKDDYSYTVEYTLVNDTGVDFDYIEVQYDVFDANNVKLGNSFTNISDVTNGQTFKVKLDLYQEGAASYKITSISSSAFK
jgi:hypothetical protein